MVQFRDNVRNFVTGAGAGNLAIGAAVSSHESILNQLAVGDQFYYHLQNLDVPAQFEVGLGTLLAASSFSRAPSGAAANLTAGVKVMSMTVGAAWFTGAGTGSGQLDGTLTFTALAGSAVPAPSLIISSSGYSTTGRGAALYVYDAAVNAAYVAANPRTAFLAAGGRGFRLYMEQRLTIEMFGGVADWNGAAGTDNYAAAMAAHGYGVDNATQGYSPAIHYGQGSYYFGQTLEPLGSFHIKGDNRGYYSGSLYGYVATRLIWPANTTCIRVKSSNTLGEGTTAAFLYPAATGSIIEGVCVQQATLGNSFTAHGVRMRAQAEVRHCEFTNIAGDCIHIRASVGGVGSDLGNANDWRVENTQCHISNGDGLFVQGSDTNGGISSGLITQASGGCGINDQSYIGCTHIAPQITGYGNAGVTYAGRCWQLITNSVTAGGATAPGTDASVWYDLRAADGNPNFPNWVNGTTYRLRLPVAFFGPSYLFGGYMENGAVLCHIADGLLLSTHFASTKQSLVLSTAGGVLNGPFGYLGTGDGKSLAVANSYGYKVKIAPAPGNNDVMFVNAYNSAESAYGIFNYRANYHVMTCNGVEVARFRDTELNLVGIPLKRDGTQVVGARGAAVVDATDAASAITQLNALLARIRAHGLIA